MRNVLAIAVMAALLLVALGAAPAAAGKAGKVDGPAYIISNLVWSEISPSEGPFTTRGKAFRGYCRSGDVHDTHVEVTGESARGIRLSIVKQFDCDSGHWFKMRLNVRVPHGRDSIFAWRIIGSDFGLRGAGRGTGVNGEPYEEDGIMWNPVDDHMWGWARRR